MKLQYINTSLVTDSEIKQQGERLASYIQHIQSVSKSADYTSPEASVALVFDETFLAISKTLAEKYRTEQLRVIFVVGIGGSNLGTKALYDAFLGHFTAIETTTVSRVIFLDTINPSYLSQLIAYLSEHEISPEQYVINVITKSGSTAETIVNLEALLTILPNATSRIVVTTDEGSSLEKIAAEKKLPVLSIPKNVGGRFSVFSNVGLFPLAVIGIDVEKLLIGAQKAIEQNTNENTMENSAVISAAILYLLNKKGYVIHDNFFFSAELESLGKWYRQLTGESVGKNGKGILPTVSIGSTDLHSMVQLYLGGPKNIVTTFYWSEGNSHRKSQEPRVSETPEFRGLVEDINGKNPSEVLKIILKGTEEAYKKNGVPFIEISLETISEESLGELMQFKMLEIMYLGKLLNINAFDQPNVEDYKEETRRLLKDTSQ